MKKIEPQQQVDMRRMGRFRISHKTLELAPNAAREILSGMIVVRATSMFEYDGIEYLGAHERFSRVGEGLEVPFYHFQVRDLVGGKYHVEWAT